jgi:hypothetical protein
LQGEVVVVAQAVVAVEVGVSYLQTILLQWQ